jgi:tRNA-2-methylthio-N6-dimethylallyladenosine synthase
MNKPETKAKTVYVKSYGCQMNVYDSERMQDVLAGQGYGLATAPEGADLVILNTCHIREKASEKVYSELGKLRVMKRERAAQGDNMIVAVAGCVAQAEGHEMMARAKGVDMVFGPQTYHRLPELLARHSSGETSIVETEFPAHEKFDGLSVLAGRKPISTNVTAFLTVQEGCDKFCTFCVVPYTRGAEYSRPMQQILVEARSLAAGGVREVTLLGQNVNAYRGTNSSGDVSSLAALVAELSSIDGIERIRYTTSHPRDMSDDLIAAHAENPKLMPYLHLPIQAGSDRILKAMNRGHTVQTYLDLIAKVRMARPDIAVSGDFIVGFPGESEADFEETLAVVRAVGYASAYSFKYSPRPGTPAAEKSRQVDEDIKTDRLQRLQALLSQQMQDFNAACLGRKLPVLLEKPGRNEGQLIGRSPYLQSVNLTAPKSRIGDIVNVDITKVGPNSIAGQYNGVPALLPDFTGENRI